MTTIAMPNGMGTPEDQLEITRAAVDDYLRPSELVRGNLRWQRNKCTVCRTGRFSIG